ncbi:DUF1289 domain-containing protein [Paraburkholderia phytofirmans]|jgi:predicted Fe-S protein YdhL (DUF1289 family)|uniref:DUF1289 domain-containing protein n=1 Tax=unclassified Paraburkholderia TaxID=2615204 RepID=UPI00104D902F|nr:DUF1289 domain-containing protein [Paraburkholderia sp. BL9I2N2]TCK90960.1 hypothetical protein B0G74_4777 [Paraburkholderia sp. BL9I2N2]
MTIQSPCIDICKLDGKTGFCLGCLRTRDEIRGWKTMSDDVRLAVINERPGREVMLRTETQAQAMQAVQETQETQTS